MIVLDARTAPVSALAYAPDGRTLALGAGGRVSLWDPFSGSERLACVPMGTFGAVSSVSFSADGRLVAAGYRGGALVWSASSGKQLHWHRLTSDAAVASPPAFVAFHPTEGRLALAQGNAAAVEVEPLSDRRLATRSFSLNNYAYALPCAWHSLAYVGPMLAAGTRDYAVVWHDVSAHVLHWPNGPYVSVAGDASGSRFAAARGRGVAVWRLPDAFADGRRWRSFRLGDAVNAVALSADGRTLLAGGNDWTAHVFDLDAGQKRNEYNWRLGPVTALAVSPDGMTAAAAGRGAARALVWDLE